MISVLQIDDDRMLCELLQSYLKEHGFDLSFELTPESGLMRFDELRPHLVILDVMLPKQEGFSIIRQIRQSRNVPVIMLTARGESADRILGLELGADDYLTKPFEPRELVARMKTILKRASQRPDELLTSGPVVLDPLRREVKISETAIDLTTSEYELLRVFMNHPGRKFTRDDLLSHLRGHESEAFGRSIDNLVSRLRNKLQKYLNSDCIQTVWGTGYLFTEPSAKKNKK
jgi:DNA-binding response OmpR family regulator